MPIPIRSLLLSLLTSLLILAGCAPDPDARSEPAVPAIWSTTEIAAGRSDAAALVQADGGWLLAWAEADSLRVQRFEASGATNPAATVTLGRRPWHPSLIAATGGWHLLWQDLDRFGETRLYSALLDLTGQLVRGPLLLAPDPVSDYTAAASDGAAIVVWADTASSPSLFGHQIDAAGRPFGSLPVEIAWGASHPMLARQNDGTWLLGWVARPFSPHAPDNLRTVNLLASQTPLPWEADGEPLLLGTLALAGSTSFVEHAALGLDQTHAYVFVTQRDAALQKASTLLLTAPLESLMRTTRAENLTLPDTLDNHEASLPTGFNTGAALAVPASPSPTNTLTLSWLAPVSGQYSVLPVAASAEGCLLVTYWQAGQWVGVQVIGASSGVSAPLALVTDSSRHLSLLWTDRAPDESESTRLQLSTTQPLTGQLAP